MVDELLARIAPRDYAQVGRLVLPDPVVAWIESGQAAPCDNEAAFGRWRLLPRMMRGVADVSTATTILGSPVAAPIGVAPIGVQGALHPDGERAMAQGVAAAHSLCIIAVNSVNPIAAVAAAAPDAALWFQLYNWPDRAALGAVIDEAQAAGVRAIVPLVNTPVMYPHVPGSVGFRVPAGMELAHGAARHGFDASLDWGYIEWLASRTSLPIVPKGILHPDDARHALDAGARAILVSNHGGRQVPRSVATLDALPAIVAEVGDRAEVYLDGGVRSGTDVLVALALGARAVFVARPVAWGLGVGGVTGVSRTLTTLGSELSREMAMCGARSLDELTSELLVRAG